MLLMSLLINIGSFLIFYQSFSSIINGVIRCTIELLMNIVKVDVMQTRDIFQCLALFNTFLGNINKK